MMAAVMIGVKRFGDVADRRLTRVRRAAPVPLLREIGPLGETPDATIGHHPALQLRRAAAIPAP